MNVIQLDIKIGWITLVFAWINLLFTCIAEEAFFRLLIQAPLAQSLRRIKYSQWIVVSIMGLLFGLAHLGGGLQFAIMAALAGFGFSLVYQRTRSIELTVLTHFGLNIVHFICFTYPLANQ
nr:CPBP family intramembrane glutamic endopeptidase [Spartinivicinus marinus]